MEFTGQDVPVYLDSMFQGYIDEYEARVMISRKEAHLVRNNAGTVRKLIIDSEAAASKVRAMTGRECSGQAISSTYIEDLYAFGSQKEGTAIVTAHCLSMKKLRGLALVQYKENEKFGRPSRYNEDRIRVSSVPREQSIPASWQ